MEEYTDWFKMKFKDDLSDINPEQQVYYKFHVINFIDSFFSDELVKNKKILDLGCGPGFHSVLLSKKGAIVTGVDSSNFLINKANEYKEKNNHKNINYIKGDFVQVTNSWEDNIFDFIIAIDTLVSFDCQKKEHQNEIINNIFKNVNKILKKEGKFYIIELHPCFGLFIGEIVDPNRGTFFMRPSNYRIEYNYEFLDPNQNMHHWFTLQEMTSNLYENNLAISRILEPFPSEQLKNENLHYYKLRLKYPMMIVYEIIKH